MKRSLGIKKRVTKSNIPTIQINENKMEILSGGKRSD